MNSNDMDTCIRPTVFGIDPRFEGMVDRAGESIECFGEPACQNGQIDCRYRDRNHRQDECEILQAAFESRFEGEQMGLFDE